ncbi:MAG: adenosylcobinamide-phosphate synthase CbiB [Cyanobacteriota bacterium]|nr:adenosylcobinamide-phosphate synthase CbiB [Cyanobacteriota bacterium]
MSNFQWSIPWLPVGANYNLIVLLIGASLDYFIGDPWGWPHPVRFMGWAIANYTKLIFKISKNLTDKLSKLILKLTGVFLAIALIFGSGFMGWSIAIFLRSLPPKLSPVAIVLEATLLASCFAGRSLRAAAEDVLEPLTTGDILKARQQLSLYVGRDTENLSRSEILRAVLETVAENATDGVMAPLFYALAGALIPGVGSIPLALAYKAASTLDSMVGYKEPPYTDIGWFSAKLEDVLTWVPCRLTVFTIALLSGKPLYVWRICRRDAIKDPSPNAGWSECAYAAALGVQMGGANSYKGVVKDKPLLGDDIKAIAPETVRQALTLTRYSFLIWLGLFAIYYLWVIF